MGFLDGLKKLGLGALEDEELYEDPSKKKAEEKKEEPQKPPVEIDEASLLFDKKYVCPVCEYDFKVRTLRTGKIRMARQDLDLRPVFKEIDTTKYEVVTCPNCGYSVLAKYFGNLTKFQMDEVRSKICANFKRQDFSEDVYTYEEARMRYELAIASAMVKKSKNSEKAYICLKMAWLIRGETEHLDMSAPGYTEKKVANDAEEKEMLQKALDGFELARMTETQIAGMDEATTDYLMAALALEVENYNLAMKMVGNIIGSRVANSRIKDKANELKSLILKRAREARETITTENSEK
ncbi:DUF2225 domain-containing protein [Butyrivibrio sp. AE3004]|uniref:DUF2225 domain-containing protein n=1 Tax=Butyrivibrio sp. AE3004 TaxID=1506994 RepID=UPI000690CF69|nr:DUF2225 domain-containing protein [Butyrivibrio sp. AE3004]